MEVVEESSELNHQLHLEQSLWLRSPYHSRIEGLCKRQEESCNMDSSQSETDDQPHRSKYRKSQKIIIVNNKESVGSSESELSSGKIINQRKSLHNLPRSNKELNYTFQKTGNEHRTREISIDQRNMNNDFMESSINDQFRNSSQVISPLKRGESNKKLNARSGNVQKELLNRFMQIYSKQKRQLTTLDVIVKLKTKLKYFFRNYTYLGRSYLLKENKIVRQFINDKSDVSLDDDRLLKSQKKTPGQNPEFQQTSLSHISQKQNYFDQFVKFVGNRINKTTQRIQQMKVIKPHYDWAIALNILFVILNYVYFYFLSLIATYDIDIDSSNITLYNGLTFMQWIIEIIVKVNTATFHRGQFIHDRKTIFKLYLKGNFIFDIIPLILIEFSEGEALASTIIKFILFIKLINTVRLKKNIEKIILMRIQHHYYIDMFNLVLMIHIVGHFIALGFYNVHRIERNYLGYDTSWIDNLEEFQDKWWKRYLQSVEWAFTLMTTGSNVGSTTPEVVYVASIMMSVFILFGYIINMIGFIIVEMQKSSDEKNRDINVINKFMNRKHTSKELKHKVNLDLEYFYQRSIKKKSEDEHNVLGKISQELSDEISLEYNKKIISKIKFLNKNFSKEVIDRLCVNVEESFYSPNQTIFKEDPLQLDPPMIFIISGKAQILKEVKINKGQQQLNDKKQVRKRAELTQYYGNSLRTIVDRNNQDIEIKKDTFMQILGDLKKGQIFGEKSFFIGISNPYEVRSTDFTTVLKLERSAFLKILKDFDRDFQIFNEIKDKAVFLSDFQQLGLKCKICKSNFHQERQCPKCHYNRNNKIVFDKLNHNQEQERVEYIRNIKQKFNSLYDMILILRDVEKIIDYIDFESVDEQLYETLEGNEFSQGNESQELKVSVESSVDERQLTNNNYDNNKGQSGQPITRQPSQKLSINPAKFEQEKIGSSTDVIDRNPSYLSANMYSRQVEDESNYSAYNLNTQNTRHNSFVVGSHLQPVSINFKSQLEQPLPLPQIKEYRDRELLKDVRFLFSLIFN